MHISINTGRLAGRRRSRGKGEGGFTLVEVMVAIMLIGLVLTAAFSTVTQALQTMETSRDYARIAQILQSEMEDLRTMSWSELEALQTSDAGTKELDLTSEFNEAFGLRYRALRLIEDRYSDQKQATIWVKWEDARGNTKTEKTVSWFTQNGLHDYYYRSF
ncbi:type IV pilus modification PilV family protein [Pelagicoccus albus]|uniref:Prepilin-type N-terminal cleavage/methylation domain-containing protein n=1 Tax=Pelagicoccus albus TaxID=415222 RepID=A0A7X1B706_9BACT|nr:type II secretion system protein [Pelagicoccus albus]MBC2606848.1 prepilin-type N-terminal cleavage/methylation domain-containing protein [Pelagicoccus albus]